MCIDVDDFHPKRLLVAATSINSAVVTSTHSFVDRAPLISKVLGKKKRKKKVRRCEENPKNIRQHLLTPVVPVQIDHPGPNPLHRNMNYSCACITTIRPLKSR